MKIFISVITIKDMGGISTSIKNLINELKDDNDITLCVLTDYISDAYKIPEKIKMVHGSQMLKDLFVEKEFLKTQSIFRVIKRYFLRGVSKIVGTQKIVNYALKKLPKIADNYDVAIAFSNDLFKNSKLIAGGVSDYILTHVDAEKKVAWIHNDPIQCGFNNKICKRLFADFDEIVNVSFDCKRIFDEMVPEYIYKSKVIYNTYDIDRIRELATTNPYSSDGKVHFVTVARLYNHQKRIDRIVETISRLVKNNYRDFDWTIVGEGSDREQIENSIAEKNIHKFIKLVGLKKNPYPYMKYANAFVLTSLYEGYGMTIKEAQILGTPTLITNFGPANETVENGKNGIICDNSTEGVYNMIKHVLDDNNTIRDIKKNLKEHPVTNKVALNQFYDVCGKKKY